MNQILASSRIYVTKEIRRKQKFYKITFTLSVITLIILLTYYVFAEKRRDDQEAISQEILMELSQTQDSTIIPDATIMINLSSGESQEVNVEELEYEVEDDGSSSSNPTGSSQSTTPTPSSSSGNSGTVKTKSGKNYTSEAIFSYPRLNINYPVLDKTSTYLLSVSLNKYWGPKPNEVGNYCIVGHNYTSGKMFGKLKNAQKGDEVKLTDVKTYTTVTYKIYDIYVIEPTDVSCTTQLTNGKRELTLLTCTNRGKQRLCVKCREV